MKTEWLEWLVLFKRYGSLKKVSEISHVTTQNIGRMFNNLEDEIGVILFEKKGTRVCLTPAGNEFAEIAEKTLNTFEEFHNKYSDSALDVTGTVKIVGVMHQALRDITVSFIQQYPNIKINHNELSFISALQYVKEHSDTFAFVPIGQNETHYAILKDYEVYCNIILLFKEETCILASRQSELANLKTVTMRHLKNKEILLYTRDTMDSRWNQLDAIFKKEKDFWNKVTMTNSLNHFCTMIEQDVAIGFALHSVWDEVKENKKIVCLKVKDKEEYMDNFTVWALVYNINKKISLSDKKFIQAIESYCAHMEK